MTRLEMDDQMRGRSIQNQSINLANNACKEQDFLFVPSMLLVNNKQGTKR